MKQTKSKQLLIRISETELAQITANAQQAGMTVSAYLREAGLNYAPDEFIHELSKCHSPVKM